MAPVVWSPTALTQLDEIMEWLSRHSSSYVNRFHTGLLSLTQDITENPFLGMMVDEYGKRMLRERLLHRYRILYRVHNDRVEIVALFDAARLLPRNLPE